MNHWTLTDDQLEWLEDATQDRPTEDLTYVIDGTNIITSNYELVEQEYERRWKMREEMVETLCTI